MSACVCSQTAPDSLIALHAEIIACRACPRLVAWREEVAGAKRRAYQDWDYWGKPVPGFGDSMARLLLVGLAPGAHGANRTGRAFTGDGSGVFLYAALHRAGLAGQPVSAPPVLETRCLLTAVPEAVRAPYQSRGYKMAAGG